jgi:phosphoribosylamine--glycine ligase
MKIKVTVIVYMRILFISNDLIAGNLALILQREGHDVRLYIDDRERRDNFINLIQQTDNWQSELDWVGTDGLIVFDDVGYGEIQDNLRLQGFQVVGGSLIGDRLEQDRAFGHDIFKSVGMTTVPLYDFENSAAALLFVREHPGMWVIKQNNHHYSKILNYVGQFADGRDVIDMLEQYAKHPDHSREKITLQERIHGIEIGIGRYFNGHDWVGPIEYNLEHPHFFPGNIGPLTSEMGTVAWYDDNEHGRLYLETLSRMRDLLRDAHFHGDFEINCIVNETGAYPLEATSRFGSPIVHLHSEIHTSPWGEFLLAIAQGKSYDLQWKKGFGIVTVLAVPPFPYASAETNDGILKGTPIYVDDVTSEEWNHIHLEEVAFSKEHNRYYISDTRGYVMYITALGKTISEAQKKSHALIQKIIFPKKMYRNDIGSQFERYDFDTLQRWGWIQKTNSFLSWL